MRAYKAEYYVGGSLVRVDYPSFAQAAQAAWNAWVVPSYWPGTRKVDWFTNKLYPPCQTKEEPAYLAYGRVSDYVNVDSTTQSSSGAIGCTSTYNDVYIQLTCPAGGQPLAGFGRTVVVHQRPRVPRAPGARPGDRPMQEIFRHL